MNYLVGILIILIGIMVMLIKPREVVKTRYITLYQSAWDSQLNARFDEKDLTK